MCVGAKRVGEAVGLEDGEIPIGRGPREIDLTTGCGAINPRERVACGDPCDQQ